MATAEEIARGISQVMADSYDGAADEEGKPLDMGLKRGVYDVKLKDPRVNDGFGCSVNGNILILNYEGEVSVKEIKDKNFDKDVEQTIADVLKFVKKHFRKVTGQTLKCKPVGEVNISVQSTSRVHTWVEAQMRYEIQGMEGMPSKKESGERTLEKSFKDWLALSTDKKPKNVTRPEEKS